MSPAPSKAKAGTRKRRMKVMIWVISAALLLSVLVTAACNLYMIVHAGPQIYGPEKEIPSDKTAECILVLGAAVRPDGSLSPALKERVDTAVRLYHEGHAECILLSGDGAKEGYDEPEAMKRECISQGVPEEAIVCDPLGLSTFESMERAEREFGFRTVLIVTQKYHLYRSICFAETVGLAAAGVCADRQRLKTRNYIREIPARVAGVFRMIFYRKEA